MRRLGREPVVRLIALLIVQQGSSACQHEPFTSCVDDSTPCEVSDESGTLDTSNASGQTGDALQTLTGSTSSQGSSSAPATADSIVAVSPAPLEQDAMVEQPSEEDGSVTLEVVDASVTTTQAEPPGSSQTIVTGAESVDSSSASTSTGESSAAPTTTEEVVMGESLITNGDFASGMTFWTLEQTAGRGQLQRDDEDALCIQSMGNVEFTVGWPDDAAESAYLPQGEYQLSFRAQGVDAEMDVKVGHAYEPYNALHEVTWSSTDEEWTQHVSSFTTRGDDATGIAFFVRLSGGRVCIDDVLLSPILTGAQTL